MQSIKQDKCKKKKKKKKKKNLFCEILERDI